MIRTYSFTNDPKIVTLLDRIRRSYLTPISNTEIVRTALEESIARQAQAADYNFWSDIARRRVTVDPAVPVTPAMLQIRLEEERVEQVLNAVRQDLGVKKPRLTAVLTYMLLLLEDLHTDPTVAAPPVMPEPEAPGARLSDEQALMRASRVILGLAGEDTRERLLTFLAELEV